MAAILDFPRTGPVRDAYAQGLLDRFHAVKAAHDAARHPAGRSATHDAAISIFDLARPLLPPHAGEGEY